MISFSDLNNTKNILLNTMIPFNIYINITVSTNISTNLKDIEKDLRLAVHRPPAPGSPLPPSNSENSTIWMPSSKEGGRFNPGHCQCRRSVFNSQPKATILIIRKRHVFFRRCLKLV